MINRYSDFLAEGKIDFILEAKMYYDGSFINIISSIKLPICKQILDLIGKDVDVITNYIEVNPESSATDVITFMPDNKVNPEEFNIATVVDNACTYTNYSQLYKYAGLNLTWTGIPRNGERVRIIREFTREEIIRELKRDSSDSIFWVKSLVNPDQDYFMEPNGFKKSPPSVKGSEIKVGRFVKKLLSKSGIEVSDKEIEEFVNQFKAKVQIKKDVFLRFRIVNGEDIKKYYFYENNSSSTGTLGSSCMRYSKCQEFLDIYTSNTDQVSMIIMMDPEKDDKIQGRAILWTLHDNRLVPEVKRFMDRVYTNNSADESIFISFAIKNGFYYKQRQSNDENMNLMFNGEVVEKDAIVSVKLKRGGRYDHFPYMDTLKYYSRSGTISNGEDDFDYKLESTEGGNGDCEECGGSGRHDCDDCCGDGTQECGECDGRGEISCDNCSGEGEIECSECEGIGEIKCMTCKGSGKDDEGKDCVDCNGKGENDCPKCKGNTTIECSECNGDGENECSNCDGSGHVDCYNCDGTGSVRCGECS